jgi:hypothetical protein
MESRSASYSGDITNFHAFALADLRGYVWDFQQSRQEGYDWAQNFPYLYSNAMDYIAEHPSKESGEGHPWLKIRANECNSCLAPIGLVS